MIFPQFTNLEERYRLDTLGSHSPPHPGKVQIPHPLEGLSCQMLFSPGTENGMLERDVEGSD